MNNDDSRWFRLTAAAALLLLVVLGSLPAAAQQASDAETFVVVGSSPGTSGSVSTARENAIQDGLITAIAIKTAEILPPEVLVKNFQRLEEILFSEPTRYIKGYKVLAEAAGEKHYRIVARVTVAADKINQRLEQTGVIQVAIELPTVLLTVAEQTIEDVEPQFWWREGQSGLRSTSGTELAAILREQGFKVIDPGRVTPQSGLSDFPARSDLTDKEAAELGQRYGAEVVVTGMASAELANVMGSGLRSYKGVFTGRAVRVGDAAQLSAVERTAVVTHTDDLEGGQASLLKAVQLAGDPLAKALAAAWKKQALEPAMLEVAIEGTNNLVNFVQFRRALSQIAGVEGIQVKEMRPNEAILTVDYRGKAQELASALMLQSFDSFGIHIYEIQENLLKVRLISG
jgi:hypothetical protein